MNQLANVAIKDITVGERYRKDYGNMNDLKESILAKGIIQPITVMKNLEGQGYLLAAGGRRLQAATELGLLEVPTIIREYTDELDLREVELFENLYREDMSWIEQNNLTARIHQLMISKYGEYDKGNPGGWSQSKTANLLDRSLGGVNRQLQMSKAIQMFPDLAKCETEDKAVRMFRKIKESVLVKSKVQEQRQAMSGNASGDELVTKFLKMADSNFRVGDVFEGLNQMVELNLSPPIALIEVDPPYGIDLQEKKKGDGSASLDRYEEIEIEAYPDFLNKLIQDITLVSPKNARMIFWFGPSWQRQVYDTIKKHGWSVDPIPAIWYKGSGQTNSPDMYLARTYEPFYICWRGEGIPIRQRGRANVFHYPPVPAAKKWHPTQRPVELMQEILRTFAWPSQIVMVPFLGSGATLLAAYREDMIGWGWELNKENKDKFMVMVEEDRRSYKPPLPVEKKDTEEADKKVTVNF